MTTNSKIIQESLIEPIITVNKMFLEQIKKVIFTHDEIIPQRIRNLYADMSHLIKQYEEEQNGN